MIILYRTFAFLIDLSIVIFVTVSIQFLSLFGVFEWSDTFKVIPFIIMFLYFSLSEIVANTTIGKRIFRIKLIKANRSIIYPYDVILRNLIFFVSPIIISLVVSALNFFVIQDASIIKPFIALDTGVLLSIPLSILIAKNNIGIHDYLSRIVVVKNEVKSTDRVDHSSNRSIWIYLIFITLVSFFVTLFAYYLLGSHLPSSRVQEASVVSNYKINPFDPSKYSTDPMEVIRSIPNSGFYIDLTDGNPLTVANTCEQDTFFTFNNSPYSIPKDKRKGTIVQPCVTIAIKVTISGFHSSDFQESLAKEIYILNKDSVKTILLKLFIVKESTILQLELSKLIIIFTSPAGYSTIEPDGSTSMYMGIPFSR